MPSADRRPVTQIGDGMTQHEVPRLGVGMVGYAFMGRAHSQAWRVAPRFFDLPLRPGWRSLAGGSAEARTRRRRRLGWADAETDWRDLVARDDVDLVDIASPGDTHAEIAIAALEAGKHVLCEKPLANTVAEAEAMADGGRAGRGARRAGHGRLQLPAGSGAGPGAAARRRGPHRRRCARSGPRTCRTGSPTRTRR